MEFMHMYSCLSWVIFFWTINMYNFTFSTVLVVLWEYESSCTATERTISNDICREFHRWCCIWDSEYLHVGTTIIITKVRRVGRQKGVRGEFVKKQPAIISKRVQIFHLYIGYLNLILNTEILIKNYSWVLKFFYLP